MNNATLTKDEFWNLTQAAHTSKDQTEREYVTALKEILKKQGPENIVRFKEIMEEYKALSYVPGLWEAADVIKGGCSDDSFIDFRAWLMTQGKETYLNALSNPDSLAALDLPFDSEYTVPGLCNMELFLYAPAYAYEELGLGDIYDKLNALPDEVRQEIRSEIRYAPGIGIPKRTTEEVEAAMPRLCEKSTWSHEPGWGEQVYSKDMEWGCEWASETTPPEPGPKLQ